MHERYHAAACQIDLPNPTMRSQIEPRARRMLEMVDMAVTGYEPFCDVKLVVFPEFAHAAPIFPTAEELAEKLALRIPNEHTERYHAKAKEHGVWIQTGTFLEIDDRYPGHVFNTTCLIGPDGILSKYRKTHPWLPWEVHSSPHDIPGYVDEVFPVVDTAIGKLGAAICSDWLFPEAIRELALGGAEVNRARAMENLCCVVAANQGASLKHYPPFSWPGGSMIVDFDGRVLAQANPGPGEQIVVGPVDLAALRAERQRRRGHLMPAHLRTELYQRARASIYPPHLGADGPITLAKSEGGTRLGRRALGQDVLS